MDQRIRQQVRHELLDASFVKSDFALHFAIELDEAVRVGIVEFGDDPTQDGVDVAFFQARRDATAKTPASKVENVVDERRHPSRAPPYALTERCDLRVGVALQHVAAPGDGGQRTSKVVPEDGDELLAQFADGSFVDQGRLFSLVRPVILKLAGDRFREQPEHRNHLGTRYLCRERVDRPRRATARARLRGGRRPVCHEQFLLLNRSWRRRRGSSHLRGSAFATGQSAVDVPAECDSARRLRRMGWPAQLSRKAMTTFRASAPYAVELYQEPKKPAGFLVIATETT